MDGTRNYNADGKLIEGLEVAKYRLEVIIEKEKERIESDITKGVLIVDVTIKNLATDALNVINKELNQ